MRELSVAIVDTTGTPPICAHKGQSRPTVCTSSANSWNTLAVKNGCSAIVAVVKEVPKRNDARPISLVMLLNTTPVASWLGSAPARVNGSTLVRDQMKPADGSMNQLFCRANW